MSTAQEILDDIDIRIPNVFTVAQKVGWLNEILLMMYKYMNASEKQIYQFTTIAGQPTYSLASDMTIDEIISVERASDLIVTTDTTFTPYTYKGLNEELDGNNYFDALNGLIGVYPIPDTTGYSFNIIYEKKPPLLSSSNLSAVPAVDDRYHNVLKFYVCSVVAKSGNNPDVELANNYTIEFNDAWALFYKDYSETKVKNPKKSRANKWW